MNISFSQVRNSFIRWHTINKRGRIPSHLKRQAVSLTTKYSVAQVASELNLKLATLNRWVSEQPLLLDKTTIPAEFVSLPPAPPDAPPENKTWVISLKLTIESLTLTITEQPIEAVMQLLTTLQAGVQA